MEREGSVQHGVWNTHDERNFLSSLRVTGLILLQNWVGLARSCLSTMAIRGLFKRDNGFSCANLLGWVMSGPTSLSVNSTVPMSRDLVDVFPV